jgi:predicted xylose isomerase-like sugar epimerase
MTDIEKIEALAKDGFRTYNPESILALIAEVRVLREDAERMEYLELHKWKDDRDGGYSGSYSFRVLAYSASTWSGAIPFSHATLREAIDAELAKEKA